MAKNRKESDEVFCRSCGKVIKKEAELCPHCGVRQKGYSEHTIGKSKVAAVLLAVFLGFWTWLYTYKKDAWKFWLNLALSIVTLTIWWMTAGWIWPVIDTAIKSREWYENY